MNYRFATPEDLKEINNILLNEEPLVKKRLEIAGYEANLVDNDTWKVTIVGVIDDDIACVGKVQGGSNTGFNYLGFFYVVPLCRKKNIGTEFMNYLISFSYNNWKAEGIDLFTIDNEPMEKLLNRFDFELSGVYEKKIIDNETSHDEKRWYKLYE